MTDLFFNYGGKTRSLRLRSDIENGDVTVYEALIDTTDYVWFEAPTVVEVWDLFELAIAAFREYRVNEGIEKIEWKAD